MINIQVILFMMGINKVRRVPVAFDQKNGPPQEFDILSDNEAKRILNNAPICIDTNN